MKCVKGPRRMELARKEESQGWCDRQLKLLSYIKCQTTQFSTASSSSWCMQSSSFEFFGLVRELMRGCLLACSPSSVGGEEKREPAYLHVSKEKGHKNPEEILDKAFENVMPRIEVRPRRMGGSIYQVPTDVKPTRQFQLASKWILDACKSKKGRSFSEFLVQEIIENASVNGSAVKKKLEVYRNAEANKVNARFAR